MQQDVKPAFEVEVLEGTKTVMKRKWDEKKEMLVEFEEEEPQGYMVYFPAGHSIRVRNYSELKRMGLHTAPGLIDMESGEEVSAPQRLSLKTHVESRTKTSRNRKTDGDS